jgi:hypothetical protein
MEGPPPDCSEWSLESDKKLLASLQQFSATFLSRINETEAALDQLVKDTEEAEARATNVGNRFRLLAHTHCIEQVSRYAAARHSTVTLRPTHVPCSRANTNQSPTS